MEFPLVMKAHSPFEAPFDYDSTDPFFAALVIRSSRPQVVVPHRRAALRSAGTRGMGDSYLLNSSPTTTVEGQNTCRLNFLRWLFCAFIVN